MRKLPTILAMVFILITLWRVGQFAETRMFGAWVGWLFSIAVGTGVFLSAYYTRDSITIKDGGKEDPRNRNVKRWAWGLLVFCVLGDGLFNVAEVWYTVNPVGWLLIVATAVFGLFPTLAAAGFGALQGHVDRLPAAPAKFSVGLSIRRRLVALIDNQPQPVAQPVPVVVDKPQPEVKQPATKSNRERIISLHTAQPDATMAQLAQLTGVTRQYVGKVLANSNGKAHAPAAHIREDGE